ncbi:hypothetical protein AQUCO_00300863v1 [Aquilegia coerulea]|uniref:CASP-like protein n=1 Tax=Aquilegia coerulea TaxID=218851 RepID=A0A2G5F0W2_AQUCA|nr:hypothetical protein AQUCO_00300863v1 [Aquilegia coerulea]
MAISIERSSSKIAPESLVLKDNSCNTKLFKVDLFLRVLVFASSLTAIVVMVTSKQTELITVPFIEIQILNTAKFTQVPAFVNLVAAVSVAGLYSIVSILASLVWKRYHSNKLLFLFILIDVVMMGIVASATGTAGSIAYIGKHGNSHAGWGEICSAYDKFCLHIGVSIGLSLFASALLLVLVILSTYTLYCRTS